MTRKSLLWIFISAAILFAADQRSFDTWNQYLGGADSSQYSSLKQINRSNVKLSADVELAAVTSQVAVPSPLAVAMGW